MSTPNTIPYIVHEEACARLERTVKRLWVLCIITLLLLVGTNTYWIWYESQWEDVVTVTQDVEDGNNNYIGNNGSIINGSADDN